MKLTLLFQLNQIVPTLTYCETVQNEKIDNKFVWKRHESQRMPQSYR